MIALSKALELTPAELGLANLDEPADPPVADRPTVAPLGPDPYGNLPRQVVEVGLALGVDLFFVLEPQKLAQSGIPRMVLDANRDQLRLRMDARYFQQNKFQFLDDELTCMLSFDALYTCTIPWSAFRAVTLLFSDEAATVQKPAPAARPAKGAGPTHLRIVK